MTAGVMVNGQTGRRIWNASDPQSLVLGMKKKQQHKNDSATMQKRTKTCGVRSYRVDRILQNGPSKSSIRSFVAANKKHFADSLFPSSHSG
jgi:hypothetical protein